MQTEEIYDDLHARLVSAGFSPGERLKPTDLQGEYACSANRLREVLLRLSKVGLVEFEMQRGFRASASTPAIRSDVTRFRILLETEGATLSIRNGGTDWEANLTAAHARLSHIETRLIREIPDSGDLRLWNGAEQAFHMTLIAACNSPMLIESYRDVYARFRQQNVAIKRDFGEDYFRSIIREHQGILDAALARDPDAMAQAIYDHLKRNITDTTDGS